MNPLSTLNEPPLCLEHIQIEFRGNFDKNMGGKSIRSGAYNIENPNEGYNFLYF